MTTKATLLATNASALCLYGLSLVIPNDLYFYIVSSNLATGIARIVLAGLMLHLVYKKRFTYRHADKLCSLLGGALVLLGIAGIVIAPLGYGLFNVIKPFDFVYLVGCGFFIGYRSLAIAPGRRKFTVPRLSEGLSLRLSARQGRA